jgi:DNA-binding transcriptional regulator YhcF (GntR family)
MATRMTGGTFFCVPNEVLDHFATLSGAATKVYFILRAHMNQRTGEAFPSYPQIMEIAGVQSASVAKAVKELQAAGLLTVRKQGRRSFYHFTNQSTSESEPIQKVKHTPSESEAIPLHKVKTNQTKEPKELTKRGDAAASHYTAAFETFWSAYGRKGTKATAAREWKKHAKGIPLAVILDAIPIYFATERVAVRGFKLDAERFLSRHVWENPTMGEENDAPARASPNGHQPYERSIDKSTAAIQRYAERHGIK